MLAAKSHRTMKCNAHFPKHQKCVPTWCDGHGFYSNGPTIQCHLMWWTWFLWKWPNHPMSLSMSLSSGELPWIKPWIVSWIILLAGMLYSTLIYSATLLSHIEQQNKLQLCMIAMLEHHLLITGSIATLWNGMISPFVKKTTEVVMMLIFILVSPTVYYTKRKYSIYQSHF